MRGLHFNLNVIKEIENLDQMEMHGIKGYIQSGLEGSNSFHLIGLRVIKARGGWEFEIIPARR